MKANKLKSPTIKPDARYVALVGLNYAAGDDNPEGLRVEEGEEVPVHVVEASPWLLEHGYVKPQENE